MVRGGFARARIDVCLSLSVYESLSEGVRACLECVSYMCVCVRT